MRSGCLIILFCFLAANSPAQKSIIGKQAAKIYYHSRISIEQKDNRLKRWFKIAPNNSRISYYLSLNELDNSIESSKLSSQKSHYKKALTWAKKCYKNSEAKDTLANGILFKKNKIALTKLLENQISITDLDELLRKTVEVFELSERTGLTVSSAQLKGDIYHDSVSGLPNNDFSLPIFQEKEEREFLELLNQARKEKGMDILVLDEDLSMACRYHAHDMAKQDYFSHQSQDRVDADLFFVAGTFDRIHIFAPFCLSCSENIAAGNGSAQRTYQQWYNSPGHYKNMFNPKAKKIGLGSYYSAASSYGFYWVMNTSNDF